MKRLFRFLLMCSFLAVLFSILAGVGLIQGMDHGLAHDAHISINGHEWTSGDEMDFGDWLGAAIGLGIAGVVVFLIVPLVLLFSVALPLLIVAAVFGGLVMLACGFGALLSSPLLVLAVVLWLAFRNSGRKARMRTPNGMNTPR